MYLRKLRYIKKIQATNQEGLESRPEERTGGIIYNQESKSLIFLRPNRIIGF
jgi:hypothetical protein